MATLSELLQASAQLHDHLCPRQVLGIRMGLLAGQALGIDLPQTDKRLLAVVETDGCLISGMSVATNCWVNHRSMRIEDYGKIAATFVDTSNGRAFRVAPRPSARRRAIEVAPEATNHWVAMLVGYQRLADDDLLSIQAVSLAKPVGELVSHAGQRVTCAACGEEIINEREVMRAGQVLCQACAGPAYYQPISDGSQWAGHLPARAAQVGGAAVHQVEQGGGGTRERQNVGARVVHGGL
jgi:formylmethanofuran dehydrogenase subunit E